MSKKRKRDASDVVVELVHVYDQLANEDESERLKAAHRLVSKIYRSDSTSDEQVKTILTRLFRGLCSSRKAARHGFAVALTELLSQLPVGADADPAIATSSIIDILERQTRTEGNASGQDERDHYFGRLFGIDAIIKSGIVFRAADQDQWRRLLEVLCTISVKKPWLRQECGWILFNTIASIEDPSLESYMVDIVEKLTSNKLIRTPEGIAIWISVVKKLPHLQLPSDTWRYGDPLASKDVKHLADILKDARGQTADLDADFSAQGSAVWSANLHFVWNYLLAELFNPTIISATRKANGTTGKQPVERVSFEDFWQAVVDDGFFSPNSSAERKHWGLLVWAKVLESAPQPLIKHVFTKNAMHYLITCLRGDDSYLRKDGRRVIQLLPARAIASDDSPAGRRFASECVVALVKAVSFADFDQLTKSKTLETILDKSAGPNQSSIFESLVSLFQSVDVTDPKQALLRYRYIVGLQSRLFSSSLRQVDGNLNGESHSSITEPSLPSHILKSWIVIAYFSNEVSEDVRKLFKEKLTTGLEQALRFESLGRRLLRNSIENIYEIQSQGTASVIDFDAQVAKHVQKAFKRLRKIPRSTAITTGDGGLELLYCVVLFEIYNGEVEAVEVLGDLLSQPHSSRQLDLQNGESSAAERGGATDSLIESLLSFAAKPSKFMRRVSLQIFESITPQVTSTGLQLLIRVLATKENSQGQHEMFEAGVEDLGDEDDSEDSVDARDNGTDANSESSSDAELIDSDVEVFSAASSSSGDSSDDESGEDNNEGEEDEELAAFDAALASALGTRRGQDDLDADDSTGSSDEDMDDDDMMALDEKLTEVFKARNQATSKKKDRKDAKVTIINFKNRVLDLIEVYLKHEHLNYLATELILPLLETARTTNTKQIADRACGTLREFCSRCKGQNVPVMDAEDEEELTGTLQLLKSVHEEACLDSSNAHSAVASQTSLLLVKILIASGCDIPTVIDVYAKTRHRQLTDKKCMIQPAFFTDWNNWCTQARLQLTKRG